MDGDKNGVSKPLEDEVCSLLNINDVIYEFVG